MHAQQYNGAHYFLLGLVVEKVTGRSYADEIQHRIARPLGLRHTYAPKPGCEIGGTVVWGKTGSMGRSTSGVFATAGGRRAVGYSLLSASRHRELMRGHVTALVGAPL